jgi:hypothetical protein
MRTETAAAGTFLCTCIECARGLTETYIRKRLNAWSITTAATRGPRGFLTSQLPTFTVGLMGRRGHRPTPF